MNLSALTDAVEAVLAPRRRFYEYRQANEYAYDAEDVIQDLEHAARLGSLPVVRLLERALALTVRTILRSDDSSGAQGDQIARLLDAHARASSAAAGTLDAKECRRLATWLHGFRFSGQQDFFDPDVAAYADALGPDGVEHYRGLVEETARTGKDKYGVQHARERLAVLTRDPDAIVAALGGEPTAQYQAENLVQALDDAGLHRHAVTYAERGLALPVTHRHGALVERLVRDAEERGDAEEVLALRAEHFRVQPDVMAFTALRRAAEECGVWAERRDAAEAHLARYRDWQWVGHLLTEGRDDEAWAFAVAHPDAARAAGAWPALCERRALTVPADTLPVYEQLVTATLEKADKRSYIAAARLLVAMRDAAVAAGLEGTYRDAGARIVEDNRRRPTLLRVLEQHRVIDGTRAIL